MATEEIHTDKVVIITGPTFNSALSFFLAGAVGYGVLAVSYLLLMTTLQSSRDDLLAYCLSVEKLMQVEAPERAQIARVILCEVNRIASHLIAFGTYALDLGAFTPFLYGFREREMIVSIFEKLSGGRLLYHYPRIGGVARDLTYEMVCDIREFLKQAKDALNSGDIDGAATLVAKAKVLLNELLR